MNLLRVMSSEGYAEASNLLLKRLSAPFASLSDYTRTLAEII